MPGAPPQIQAIFCNFILGIIDVPRIKVIQYLNINLVGLLQFTIGIPTYYWLIAGCGWLWRILNLFQLV